MESGQQAFDCLSQWKWHSVTSEVIKDQTGSSGSHGMFILRTFFLGTLPCGTQLPCCKEVQATGRGHMWASWLHMYQLSLAFKSSWPRYQIVGEEDFKWFQFLAIWVTRTIRIFTSHPHHDLFQFLTHRTPEHNKCNYYYAEFNNVSFC